MLTDPLGDMITRVRNGQKVFKDSVLVPFSSLRWNVAQAMLRGGVIRSCHVENEDQPARKQLRIDLRYYQGEGAASELRRISKPGRRVYIGRKDLVRDRERRSGFPIFMRILSTSKGVLLDREALTEGIGGECLLAVR